MPIFKIESVKQIKRKDKPDLFIGHSDGADYFLNSNEDEIRQQLAIAAQNRTEVIVNTTNYEKPKAGSMFINSID